MHKKLLASAALLGLLASGAYAATPPAAASPGTIPSGAAAPATASRVTLRPATAAKATLLGTEPLSVSASNIVPADTHSLVAPKLPTPPARMTTLPEWPHSSRWRASWPATTSTATW